jgi:hypothetical protein
MRSRMRPERNRLGSIRAGSYLFAKIDYRGGRRDMCLFFRASFVILMTPIFGQSAALPAIADDDAPKVAIAEPAKAAAQIDFLSI